MPGVDFTNAYSYENVSADEKLFKYNSSGWFDNGHCFNFTATFKVLKPGNPGTFVYVNDWNRGVANRTVVIDPTIFTITNKGNDTIRPGASGNVNYGGIASFEIFVRNIGGNFYEYVPIDIYFDPDELDYVNYTVGVNPDVLGL